MRISDWSSDVCSSDLCNIPFYPQASEAVGIDNSPAMLRRAARRACRNGRRVELLERDLTANGLSDRSFDTIVATYVMGCLPRALQRAALQDLRREHALGGRRVQVDEAASYGR